MALLTKKTNFVAGDMLTAQDLNNISETAVEAYQLAEDAKNYAETLIMQSITETLNSEV